jgi:WhiB family transcriptional regulator, redox-sensing transcriptional regulator
MPSHDWEERAACQPYDTNLFFPEKNESPARGLRVCASCSVRVECLEYAIEAKEVYGIWGGTTEKERQRLLGIKPKSDYVSEAREAAKKHWKALQELVSREATG